MFCLCFLLLCQWYKVKEDSFTKFQMVQPFDNLLRATAAINLGEEKP